MVTPQIQWNRQHLELMRERAKTWNQAHPELVLQRAREWNQAHKERTRAIRQAYKARNREEINRKTRERYHRKKLERLAIEQVEV